LTKKEPDWVGLEVNRRELEKYVKVLTGNKCISELIGRKRGNGRNRKMEKIV